MAQVSNNPITSSAIDWTDDPNNHLPFSGSSIQTFIRANIEIIESRLTQEELANLLNLN